jgi:nitroreductase
VIRDLLTRASRAPSGGNVQPWLVRVVSGNTRQRLVDAGQEAFKNQQSSREYTYYPAQWFTPYKERRKECGLGLYQLLGLTRDNKAGMAAQHARNYALFDAPVGLFFTLDRRLSQGSWLDMGMFIGTVMMLARAYGLETCPQAAWVEYGDVVRRVLDIPEQELFLCALSLGYEDTSAPENSLRTSREPVDGFTQFLD